MNTLQEQQITELIKKHCIGLTGGIASGKSTIAAMLRQRGYIVYDADQFAHRVVEPGREGLLRIREEFGDELIQDDGTLNRSKMRDMIAHDPTMRKKLDRIMHPLIRQEFYKQILATDLLDKPRVFFYEAALIHETGCSEDFAATWCAFCSSTQQVERMIQRSGGAFSKSQGEAMLRAQMPIDEKARRSTVTIDTSASLGDVRDQLDRLLLPDNILKNSTAK